MDVGMAIRVRVPGTRPDGHGHGYHFSPVGGAHTRPAREVGTGRGSNLTHG
jgi:hypothetical protein